MYIIKQLIFLKEKKEGRQKSFTIIKLSTLFLMIATLQVMATGYPEGVLQTITVSGNVVDMNGESLPGVSISIKGTSQGTATDAYGAYSLQVPNENATLVFSYIGFISQEVTVGNRRTININLLEDTRVIEEVVVVGYGVQKRGHITGSISTVQAKELTVAPIASTTNALTGRIPGLIAVQQSGQPGYDNASLNIRGFGAALVIVDGIESSFNNIDANQIETVSVLKDGAASVYGSRGGRGVIIVTTKRGQSGKPSITLNSSFTGQGVTIMPDKVSSGQLAEMSVESHKNSGAVTPVPYTPEEIKKFYDGSEPYLYPNTNWRKVLIRDWAPVQQHNLSIRGGRENLKFYGFLGFLNQESMWKNNGGNYKRYNFQANMDANILDNLTMELTISSIVESSIYPWRTQQAGSNDNVWQDYYGSTLPTIPASFPDPDRLPNAMGLYMSNYDLVGYQKGDNNNLRGSMVMKYDVKQIQGLSFKFFINYNSYFNRSKQFSRPVSTWNYDPGTDTYIHAGGLNQGGATLNQSNSWGRTITGNLSVQYNRTFADKHQVGLMGLFEAIDSNGASLSAYRSGFLTDAIDYLFAGSSSGATNNGNASENGRASFVGKLNYAFYDKYLIEGIFRADGYARFPTNHKWGYFSSVSFGWRISEESFMKGISWIENLKLRASYGASGDDSVINFNQWLAGYSYDNFTYVMDGGAQQGLIPTVIPNPNLTWEKMEIYNLGLDFSLDQRKLYGETDFFFRDRTGMHATRTRSLPSSFGATMPRENLNSQNTRGFELILGTVNHIGDFSYDLSGNLSWSRSKWVHYEEPEYDDPDEIRLYKLSGRWTDYRIGYRTNGLFKDQNQINALTHDIDQRENASLRPGDLWLLDTNGDGLFNWQDQEEIGKGTTPHWMFGFNLYLSYKWLDFTALMQGAFDYYKYMQFYNNLLMVFWNERWTEENNNTNALVPRLGGASTNYTNSDHYYRKAGYLRVKNMSLGFSLPQQWLKPANIQHARLYIAGTNLLTFDKLKKYQVDPEAGRADGADFNAGFSYPVQRTVTAGLNITF